MKNPFKFGKPVSGEQFINRKKELKSLKQDILSDVNLILYSRRRTGKTSLILKLLAQLKKEGHPIVYIDLFQADSINNFIEYYAEQIASAKESTLSKGFKWFAGRLKTLKPRIYFDEEMRPAIEFGTTLSPKNQKKVLSEVLALPEELASDRKKAIVVFDEFQDINNIGGIELEKELRATIQRQENVKYVFMGSKEHMIQQMFTDESRPFYQSGVIRKIDIIDRQEFLAYITHQFQKKHIFVSKSIGNEICDLANDIPNYIQMLCYYIWNVANEKKPLAETDINMAVGELLTSQGDLYQNIMESLSLGQRALAKAIARLGGKHITSREYLISGKLTTSSTIYKNAQMLLDRNILEKVEAQYEFKDPFFELWLKTAHGL